MLGQKFLAHPRLVIKPVQRRFRRNLHEVAIPFLVFGQHQQMVIGIALGWSALDVVVVLLADIKLATHDRLDPSLVRGIHKVHRTKNISVVGHGDRRHPQPLDAFHKLLNVASAIQQRVIAMQMQMYEFRHSLRVLLVFVALALGSSNSIRSKRKPRSTVIHRRGKQNAEIARPPQLRLRHLCSVGKGGRATGDAGCATQDQAARSALSAARDNHTHV